MGAAMATTNKALHAYRGDRLVPDRLPRCGCHLADSPPLPLLPWTSTCCAGTLPPNHSAAATSKRRASIVLYHYRPFAIVVLSAAHFLFFFSFWVCLGGFKLPEGKGFLCVFYPFSVFLLSDCSFQVHAGLFNPFRFRGYPPPPLFLYII